MDEALKRLWNKIPKPIRNKYFVTAVLFVGFMVFFDRHDVLTQIRLQRAVNKLEQDKVFYEDQIKREEQQRLDMEINQERFAREKYYMQRNNEDVFIIKDQDQDKQ